MIGRNELLAPAQRVYEVVDTSLGPVRIQSLTERQRSQWEADSLDRNGKLSKKGLLTAKARLIAESVVDEKGERLFTPMDVDRLQDLDAGVSNKLSDACQHLSGISEADADIEELEKNSEEIPSDSSPSG